MARGGLGVVETYVVVLRLRSRTVVVTGRPVSEEDEVVRESRRVPGVRFVV